MHRKADDLKTFLNKNFGVKEISCPICKQQYELPDDADDCERRCERWAFRDMYPDLDD